MHSYMHHFSTGGACYQGSFVWGWGGRVGDGVSVPESVTGMYLSCCFSCSLYATLHYPPPSLYSTHDFSQLPLLHCACLINQHGCHVNPSAKHEHRTSASEPWPTYCMSTNSVGQWWMRRITHRTARGEEDGAGQVRTLSHRFAFFLLCWETGAAEEAFCPSPVTGLRAKCQRTPHEARNAARSSLHFTVHVFIPGWNELNSLVASVKQLKWKKADLSHRSKRARFQKRRDEWHFKSLDVDGLFLNYHSE